MADPRQIQGQKFVPPWRRSIIHFLFQPLEARVPKCRMLSFFVSAQHVEAHAGMLSSTKLLGYTRICVNLSRRSVPKYVAGEFQRLKQLCGIYLPGIQPRNSLSTVVSGWRRQFVNVTQRSGVYDAFRRCLSSILCWWYSGTRTNKGF